MGFPRDSGPVVSQKPSDFTVSEWIGEIRRIWARGPASTLELARVMCAARDLLPRGGWTALWKSGRVPFARRKAYYLLVIGDGLGWATAQTFAHLPTGWTILYCLAKLDRRTLERLIGEGFLRRLAEFIATNLTGLSPDDREHAAKELTRLVDQIRGPAVLEYSSPAAGS